MNGYDFSGLTRKQQELLTFEGWNVGSKFPSIQPGKATVKKLIERGLVVPHEVKYGAGPLAMYVTEYEVPIHVHMAWCMQCKGDVA